MSKVRKRVVIQVPDSERLRQAIFTGDKKERVD